MLRGLILIVPILLALWLERAVRKSRPLWLAPFAFVPIGRRRRVQVSPSVRASAGVQPEQPYREPAKPELDAARLPIPPHGSKGETRMESRDDIVAVSSPHHSAVARIDIRVDDDMATLRARCLPIPLSVLGWAGLLLFTSRGSIVMTAIAIGLPLVLGVGSFRRLRPHVDEAMDEITRALARD